MIQKRILPVVFLLALLLTGCNGTKAQEAGGEISGPSCTLSISCENIVKNMNLLDPEKAELVPEDGILYPATKLSFTEGENVFDVLLRTCLSEKIHLEYSESPMYHSMYIEGIGNLYEFDCGALSGWEYSVNGVYPNYGCSSYTLKDGDVIEFHYTTNLGQDLGQEVAQ